MPTSYFSPTRAAWILPSVLLTLVPAAALAQQQLTAVANGVASAASLSGDGTRVAYQSSKTPDDDDADDHNPGSTQIFVVDADGFDPVQLTDGNGTSQQPDISADAGRVAFVSDADLTGNNADASLEAFMVEVDGTSGIQRVSLSADGARVAFSATAYLTGNNGDASREKFMVDSDGNGLVQVSDGPAGTTSQSPTLSGDGGQVVFASYANLANNNGDGNVTANPPAYLRIR